MNREPNETPVIVCSCDGKIIGMNVTAAAKVHKKVMGTDVRTHLSDSDILCFERLALGGSCEDELTACRFGIFRYAKATVRMRELKREIVLKLYVSKEDVPRDYKAEMYAVSALSAECRSLGKALRAEFDACLDACEEKVGEDLTERIRTCFSEMYRSALLSGIYTATVLEVDRDDKLLAAKVLTMAMDTATQSGYYRYTADLRDRVAVVPTPMNFAVMAMNALAILSGVTGEKDAAVTLDTRQGNIFVEIALPVREPLLFSPGEIALSLLIEQYPALGGKISLCDLIARNCRYDYRLLYDAEQGRLSLSFVAKTVKAEAIAEMKISDDFANFTRTIEAIAPMLL